MDSRVIALSVKSLEQQTKSVSLPRNSTVLELKQKIKLVFDIEGERQRLIFRGRVLKDDKNLLDYDNLDDGKVIHLVVRPIDASSNPNNDEPSRVNNRHIRTSAREISDDYAVITVDATLDTIDDARTMMQNILNNVVPGASWEQRRHAQLSQNTYRNLNANRPGSLFSRSSHDYFRRGRTSHLDGLSDTVQRISQSLMGDLANDMLERITNTLPPIIFPVPSSLELSLSRTLAFMSDLRTIAETPAGSYDSRHNSNSFSTRVIQESRQRLRDAGDRQATQVALVVDELADIMALLAPQLREVGQSLRTENNERTSEEQLAHVLRISRMVQLLSSTLHFLGSILSTAEPEIIHSPTTSTNNATTRNTSSGNITGNVSRGSANSSQRSTAATSSSSTAQQAKRKHDDNDRSSSSSSSKRQRE